MWDGKAMEVLSDPSDTAHEIAHWLLADAERRKQLNYGWQWDWKYPGYHPTGVWVRPGGHEEENRACMLQFAMLARIGFKGLSKVYEAYNYTIDGKLVDGDVRPARKQVQPQVRDFSTWLVDNMG